MLNSTNVPRNNITVTVSATPTITASSAYVSGYRLGSVMALTGVVREDTTSLTGVCELRDVTIVDSNRQSSAIDIWFFNSSPTITSADHAAFSITAANALAAGCLGAVSVGTAYSDSAVISVSSTPVAKQLQVTSTSGAPANTIYAVAIARGTPTYTTTTALQFQFSFYVD